MLTVTLKSTPNDTSTVTVAYAGESLMYAFPHDSPAESVTRACMFADRAARSGSEASLVIINLAKAEHHSHGIVRSGSPMAFASALLRG